MLSNDFVFPVLGPLGLILVMNKKAFLPSISHIPLRLSLHCPFHSSISSFATSIMPHSLIAWEVIDDGIPMMKVSGRDPDPMSLNRLDETGQGIRSISPLLPVTKTLEGS
jgi:hypothetical protein